MEPSCVKPNADDIYKYSFFQIGVIKKTKTTYKTIISELK